MFVAVGVIGGVAWLFDPIRDTLALGGLPRRSLKPSFQILCGTVFSVLTVWNTINIILADFPLWMKVMMLAIAPVLMAIAAIMCADLEGTRVSRKDYRAAFIEAGGNEEPRKKPLPFDHRYVMFFASAAGITYLMLDVALNPYLGTATRLCLEACGIVFIGSCMTAIALRVNPNLDIHAYRQALTESELRVLTQKIGA